MNSKERMMIALHKGKPDRLPATVHQWQGYHLDEYMGGISDLEAFKQVGLDAQIQYFQDMGQFWLVDVDSSKFNTPTWRDEVDRISNDPDHRIVAPHHLHAGGHAHLQDRGRPEDDLDHRVPHQARRGHRADPQVYAGPAARPRADRTSART